MKKILAEIDRLQKEINKHRPRNKTVLKQIREYYKVGLTYSSNALEGNSLTESETKIVIEDGLTINGKPLKDHFEALGHGEAYDLMYNLYKHQAIAEADIKKLHKLFYYRIDAKNAGKYRKIKVFISGSKYPLPLPENLPALMADFVRKLPAMKKKLHPVEFAARVHKDFVFIHPFVDGNGRLARLLMNLALLQAGYNITIIPPIRRRDYIDTLEKAHEDDKPVTAFIAEMVMETQKDYIRLFEENKKIK
ncbi:MAG: Fic family protein [Elusimicrobia bacterium]|nr:Fic family protein [Elusimicrobiota bacterium]